MSQKGIYAHFPTRLFIRNHEQETSHTSMHAALILDNSYDGRFCSDVADVDVGKYRGEYRKREQIPCLREMFCANIMLFMMVPASTITGNTTPECGVGVSRINSYLKEFCTTRGLPFYGGARAKRTIDISRLPTSRKDDDDDIAQSLDEACSNTIRRILSTHPAFVERYRVLHPRPEEYAYGVVSYKISFSQYSYKDALDFCSTYAEQLAENTIYLHEIDFTVDYGCSFNKARLAAHVLDNSDDDNKYFVLDNDKIVGKNCLSLMHVLPECVARCKIYNKFVQSLETRSITTRIGMHLDDWINNKELQLRESMLRSLDHGFTRLEITFYAGEIFSKDFYEHELEQLQELVLGSGKMFQCPIEKQWQAWTEALQCNMAIIDLDTKEYALGMWCNTITKRIGGVSGLLTDKQAEDPERIVQWIAAHFSLDRGIINIATLQGDTCPDGTDSDTWTPTTMMCLRSFVKFGEQRTTYVPGGIRGCLWYSLYIDPERYNKADRSATPPERGLTDMPNIQLRIFNTRSDSGTPLLCGSVEIVPCCSTISTNTTRQRSMQLASSEAMADFRRSMESLSMLNMQAIKNAQQQIAASRAREAALCRYKFGVGKTLLHVPHDTLLEICAFKEYSSIYGSSYILHDILGNTYRANAYITACLNRHRHLIAFDNTSGIYYARDYGIVFTCMRGSDYCTSYGNRAASISLFRGVSFDTQQLDNHLTEAEPGTQQYITIPEKLKHKDLTPIDNLLLKTDYIVQGIRKYIYRGSTRYMLLINDIYYASNYWLEQNLATVTDTSSGKTNYEVLVNVGVFTRLRTDIRATTPHKKVQLRCAAL